MKGAVDILIRFIFALAFAMPLQAQVFVELAKDTMLIGEQTELKVSLSNKGQAVIWPEENRFRPFEVVETQPTDTIKKGKGLARTYVVTTFDTGVVNLPMLPVIIGRDTFRWNAASLVVQTVPVDTAEAFKPISPIMKAPLTAEEVLPYLYWALGVLLAIVLIAAVVYLAIQRRREAEKPLTPLDHHAKALNELQLLKDQKLWQKNKNKDHYQQLSTILRTYIEGRFHVPALEQTTTEITPLLDLPEGMKKKVIAVLQQADLAKYAKGNPTADVTVRLLKDSLDFVTHTKPREEEASEKTKTK